MPITLDDIRRERARRNAQQKGITMDDIRAERKRRNQAKAIAAGQDIDEPVRPTLAPGVIPGTPGTIPRTPEQIQRRKAEEQEHQELLRQGVDFDTGIGDNEFRTNFGRMDSDTERAQFLDQIIGEDNWGQDMRGNYIIGPQGLAKIGIDTDKPRTIEDSAITRYDISDLAGSSGAAIGGTAAGIAFSPFGPGVALPMAFAFGELGKAVDEAFDEAQGLNFQPKEEVSRDIAKAGMVEGALEGAFRGARAIGRKVFLGPARTKKPKMFGYEGTETVLDTAKVSPDRQKFVLDAIKNNMRPSIYQATRRPLIGRAQQAWWNILGNPVEEQNARGLMNLSAELQRKAGGGETRQLTGTQVGRNIKQRFAKDLRDAEDAIKISETYLDRTLQTTINNVGDLISKKTVQPSTVREAIRSYKEDLSKRAATVYEAIDNNLLGGQPIISTRALRVKAKEILEKTNWTEEEINVGAPQLIERIAQAQDVISLKKAQNMRYQLREGAYNPDILTSVEQRDMKELVNTLDQAFNTAEPQTVMRASPIVNKDGNPMFTQLNLGSEEAAKAAKSIRKANEWYRSHIKNLNNLTIRRLAKEPGEAGATPPARAIAAIREIGDARELRKLRNIMQRKNPQMWDNLRRTIFEDMMIDATKDRFSREINPNAFLNQVDKFGVEAFDSVYPKEGQAIRDLMRKIAARNGTVSAESLRQGSNVRIALQENLKRIKDKDRILEQDLVGKMARNEVDDGEVIKLLLRPNKEQSVREVRRALGRNSARWLAVRQKAMGELLSHIFVKTEDPFEQAIRGLPLVQTLRKVAGLKPMKTGKNIFGSTVVGTGEDLTVANSGVLKEIFGQELTGDLIKYAETAQGLTAKPNVPFAGGIVASQIALHPIQNLPKLLQIKALRGLFSRPGVLKWFVGAIEAPKTRKGFELMGRIALLAQQEAELAQEGVSDESPSSEKFQQAVGMFSPQGN